ncbi:MAG: hypothetical protein ABIA63_12365, partial [bacterium]
MLKPTLKQRILKAADWFVNSQVVQKKPYWDANHGRYLYNRHIKSGTTVLGINWSCARGIMVALSAYELTGKARYLNSAKMAGDYLKALQIIYPDNDKIDGSIAEQVPQSIITGTRDAVEAADAFLFIYRITGEREYLDRATMWAQWFFKNIKSKGWPSGYFKLYSKNSYKKSGLFLQAADAMFFFHLYKATGQKAYVKNTFPFLLNALKEKHFRNDGALISDRFACHHTGMGRNKTNIVLNDDGCGVALLCDYAVNKERSVLDLCLSYGNYLISQKMPLGIYSAFPIQAIYLAELSKISGNPSYIEFVESNLKHLIDLQVLSHKYPNIKGAFRGEDEESK